MKTKIFPNRVTAVSLAVVLFSPMWVFAQMPGGNAGMNASMTRLFGSDTNFISKAEARVLDKNKKEITSMVMGFQMLNGNIRIDINMADVKSAEMSPQFAATMKQMGMDQMATILLTDQKTIITIYPGLKSFAQTPMPKEEVETSELHYKIEKSRVGKESIDGHVCEKANVTITDPKDAKEHFVVWYATDLKDFPIQMQIPAEDSTLIMKFKDVKLGRPDPGNFQAPGGLTKYDNVNALMSDIVTKKMNLGAPVPASGGGARGF